MLKKVCDFAEMVWAAAATEGIIPARIADKLLLSDFPRTVAAAKDEGGFAMFRGAVIDAAKRILRQTPVSAQMDFTDIDPRFHTRAAALTHWRYTVESLGELVEVPELIKNPALLDDARKLMRRKGMECLVEARKLDALYKAVMAAKPTAPHPETAGAGQ
jgi:hypothetical protein